MTESGKTTFAKLLAKRLIAKRKNVAVLDPIYDPGWAATYKTDDPEDFAEYLRTNREVYAFIDESESVFGDAGNQYNWFATRSRHYGHSVTFLAQRTVQLPKTVRDQCTRLYLFTTSQDDGKIHASEWNKNHLRNCNQLRQFEFFAVDRYEFNAVLRLENYKDIVSVESERVAILTLDKTRRGGILPDRVLTDSQQKEPDDEGISEDRVGGGGGGVSGE